MTHSKYLLVVTFILGSVQMSKDHFPSLAISRLVNGEYTHAGKHTKYPLVITYKGSLALEHLQLLHENDILISTQ